MKRLMALLAFMAAPALADERQVYLLATVQLGGSTLAQSIFLHEPEITTLEACQAAVRDGQRDRDWQRYHHIFMRDRFKGFTGQLDYRCVFTTQRFSDWNDRARYSHPYLVSVDAESNLKVERMPSQARCSTALAALSQARRAQSRCSVGNQALL